MLRSSNPNLIQVAQKTGSIVVEQAMRRLQRAEQDIDLLTPAELYQYVDPVAVERSFRQEQLRITQRLLLIRNFLFILPIILTFAVLGWAFLQYQAYLASHSQDVNQPFLLLWQNGFNTGNTLLAPSTIAVLDAGIFLVGSIIGIIIGIQRLQGRQHERMLRMGLERTLEDLSDTSFRQMRQLANPNRSQTQVLSQVNLALQGSIKISQDVQEQIVQVTQRMGDFQQSTFSLSQNTGQLGEYLNNLRQNLTRFEKEATTSVNRLSEVQEKNIQALAQMSSLLQDVRSTLINLDGRFNQVIQVIATTESNLTRTTSSLDALGKSFTTGITQFAQETSSFTALTRMASESTQQLTNSQQMSNQIIKEMLQRLQEVTRVTSGSAGLLTRLTDTEADTMRAVSSLVTRLEIIQQLLGRLVMYAGVGAQGDPFLQSLLGAEQKQQSLGINPLEILSFLQQSNAQPIQALVRQVEAQMGQNRLDPVVFSDIIATFRDMNLVTLSGRPGEEYVKLTGLGRQIIGTLVSP